VEVTGKNVPFAGHCLTATYTDDPYWWDIVELSLRVADCFDTHPKPGTFNLDYFTYWFQGAQANA
jgi:hypothetical protein